MRTTRDPRLDGTIAFTNHEGFTFPFVSDVVNSSPTPDNSGERDVLSLFGELDLPVLDSLDVQLALRYEDFSDVGDTFVAKVAAGWRVLDQLLVRGSWSQAYRTPNLITVNESIVARANTRRDYVCQFVQDRATPTPSPAYDCTNQIQRTAQGSQSLVAEESVNTSLGVVVSPIKDMTITADYWSIAKENTIGLLGEENHTILELLDLLAHGTSDCSSLPDSPNTLRDDPDAARDAAYMSAGICPSAGGDLISVSDRYANLDSRDLEGLDVGFFYEFSNRAGKFNIKYNVSMLSKFTQESGGDSARIAAAVAAGDIPESYFSGFGDLIGRDGNQEMRQKLRFSWRKGVYGASFSFFEIGEFYQNSLTLDDGTRYVIPSFITYDATFDYTLRSSEDLSTRFRVGIKNLTDERAPLADRFFGYFADAHTDYGRWLYVDVRVRF